MDKTILIILGISIPILVTLLSLNLVYGLAGSLEELQSNTIQEQSYQSELINFINQSDIYANLTWLTPEQKEESKENLNELLPTVSLERLEQLAKEIMNNGSPLGVIADISNEKLAPHYEKFKDLIGSED